MDKNKLNEILGPLADSYNDSKVHDIFVDAPDKVYFYQGRQIVDVKDEIDVEKLIKGLLEFSDSPIDQKKPLVAARLRDGARIVVARPPLTMNGPTLSIMTPVTNTIKFEDLVKLKAIDEAGKEIVKKVIASGANILVAGNMGSGKTTFLNILADLVPENERVVAIEQAFEMQLKRKYAVHLESSPDEGVSFQDLIRKSVCFRPDRLIVNEVFGKEAMDVINLMRSGVPTLSCVHAENTIDALNRLELMCLNASMNLTIDEIRLMISSTLKYVTFQEQSKDGLRRIVGISRIDGVKNGKYIVTPLYKFNDENGSFEVAKAGKDL